MRQAVGLDFGTTNSAIAVASAARGAQLATFEADSQITTTFRSILYFFHPKDEEADGQRVVAGPQAIRAYRDAEPRGRFIQSMKSFLGSRLFEQIFSPDRLRSGGELTSVDTGLALCALRLSAARLA